MPRPSQAAELSALRARRVAADAALTAAIADVERVKRARDAERLRPGGDLPAHQAALARARARYDRLRADRNGLLAAFTGLSAAAARADDDAASAALFGGLEGDTPIALFPVRLETRYQPGAAAGVPELRIRIYPDDVNVQRHVAALTEAEQQAARAYWEARFLARAPQAVDEAQDAFDARSQRPQALWAEMVRALRAPRAAFVVQALRPVNAGAVLDAPGPPPLPLPAPDFPPTGEAGSRLAAQPVAVMLPDRFCAVGLAAGGAVVFRRFGAPVPDVQAAAPVIHPGDAPPAGTPPQDPFEGEAAWLAHYDAALAQGMAITVTQADVDAFRRRNPRGPAFNLGQPLERLIVLGVDWTLTPDEAAGGVSALLEAHAASGGMAFVPIGTATNNTGAESSGHAPGDDRDPGTPQPPAPTPGTSAVEALRFALGLPDAALAASGLPHEQRDDAQLSSHMLNALYRALAGHYLEEFWADPKDSSRGTRLRQQRTLDALRDHVTGHLRPAGPLQPLRIAMQPYGMLPVVASGRFVAEGAFEAGLKSVLDLLRPSWRDALGKVPRFDGQAATTHRLLQHGPWAQSVSYRETERDPVGDAVKEKIEALQNAQRFHSAGLFMHMLGATWGAPMAQSSTLATFQIAGLVLKPEPSKLPSAMPWVQADAQVKSREAPTEAMLAPNYIASIANAIAPAASTKTVLAGMRKAGSLLQGLLAYSADLEADAANRRVVEPFAIAVDGIKTVQGLAQTPRTVGIEKPEPNAAVTTLSHVGELAFTRAPALTGADSVGQYTARAAHEIATSALATGTPLVLSWFQETRRAQFDATTAKLPRDTRDLAGVKASLLALQGRSVGELNWALRTTLDSFDHRLDTWYTSLATRRLARLRQGAAGQRRTGVHVGAFGVVEGLQPDGAGHRESLGHVLAPSLRHAAAAAVLRSGYLANDAQARAAFTLDLSSRRVRNARDIFEGLAQGQPLAVLIGYRFERGLRDALLAQFVLDYRRTFPLRPPAAPAATAQEEAIVARDVTDGVKLLNAGAAAANVVPAGDARNKVQALLDQMATLWDAVCDVAVSEGVYQLAQGNMERAAAALATLDKQAMPIEPQSVLSPRDGISYTQRLVLLLDPQAPAPAGWPADAAAAAEPRLNAWLADLIGPPGGFALTGRVITDDDRLQELSVDPSQLGLSPLALSMALDAPGGARGDTQVMAPDEAAPGAKNALPEDLSRLRLALVEALFAQGAAAFPGRALRLQVDEQGQQPGLVQLEALLGLARRLVGGARAALRSDLAVIEGRFDAGATDGDFPGADAAEFDQRAAAAVEALQSALKALQLALAAKDADATTAALRGCRVFGVPGTEDGRAVSLNGDAALQALLERGDGVRRQLEARLRQAGELRADVAAADTVGKLAPIARATLEAVFGRGFPVLPLFTMGAAAPGVQACLDAQATLGAGRAAVVPGWLPKLAKVRRSVDHLQSLLLARESLVAPYPSERFAVLQSTGRSGGADAKAPWEQPWVALPEAWPDVPDIATDPLLGLAHQRPDLAVALHAPQGLPAVQAGTPLAALVCDDWNETVPLHTTTAGVAFHYDAPGARAPQTLLLAVPPALDMAWWSFDDVLATVLEALELSRLRLVRPAQLDGAVNLALPMNLINDLQAPTVAGLDFKHLADQAVLSTALSSTGQLWASGKV
ncbi:hypothetical protein [Methylibium sp.]|uniref:hypothetical protein n=1 Tax=Methylibium sp. TaxID=2067992 RepID=UPI003D13A449